MDTIFALSSGALPSGVAVVRLSGPHVKKLLTQFVGSIPEPRYMNFCVLRSVKGEMIDQALVVYFPAPKSFTGEDCAEFHLHGSKAVVARFLEELGMFPECRLAEPGEFVRRAFTEGKLDLTAAEGLADLIRAETESQRRLSLMGTSGALATLYRSWRKRLIRARALVEANLDFSDEGDVVVTDKIWEDITLLQKEISQHILAGKRAGIMRDGLKIVIAGAPNSGKSSIVNRLAGRDIAIVTEAAGTTRDALEIRLILGDLPVLVTDTAGLRDTENHIERMGIDIAVRCIQEADLVLVIYDMQNPQIVDLPETSAKIWHIGNKRDLALGDTDTTRWILQISAKTGEGWDNFIEHINTFCQEHITIIGEMIPVRERQVALLKNSLIELNIAFNKKDLELCAEHLRHASDCLGRITGDIDIEDLLDVVFSEFCIGK
ncbi:MAG: tRNA modification GTPase [Candidatus Tokpelaia sp. JSC085]|nr:MAG: tRNA modification GTPase [Candidatus Tokpelaia sp. JSC085]